MERIKSTNGTGVERFKNGELTILCSLIRIDFNGRNYESSGGRGRIKIQRRIERN